VLQIGEGEAQVQVNRRGAGRWDGAGGARRGGRKQKATRWRGLP